MNIAVLASGSGSNLQAIINAVSEGYFNGKVTINAVIVDRDCYAIERALDAELNTWFIERGPTLSTEINEICVQENIDLIVLAGFLSILDEKFCHQWNKKIINLHPSLLPKYGGMGMYGEKVHQAVLAENEKESGATVHYVTAGVDEGEVILQESFEIPENADLLWLKNRISEIEKPLLLKALKKIALEN
ncbi:MAG: phosphoribosylglycinamide formyltransferase [Weeksellaceae bacterium]